LILAAKEVSVICDKCGAVYVRKQDSEDVKFGDPDFMLPALKTAPIHALYLSVRSRNCLDTREPRVETIGDLCKLDERDLLELRNCGYGTIKDIKRQLASVGLSLRERGK
jgi:DNA-directed RNA polymerase alpha subunit